MITFNLDIEAWDTKYQGHVVYFFVRPESGPSLQNFRLLFLSSGSETGLDTSIQVVKSFTSLVLYYSPTNRRDFQSCTVFPQTS